MQFMLFGMVIILSFVSCYSFKASKVATDIYSFYVDQFKLAAYNAPATINQTFTEALKDKIARESRLKFIDGDADVDFEGTIQTFIVAPVAPQPNEQTAFNRLTIGVNVIYTNHKNPADQWNRTFSHFADFGTDQDLLSVQDELIDIIFKQIMEDVFNQAFNNW
jgi:hypothetical protein